MTEIIITTSISTAVLVSLAIWFSRLWITERLKADIKLDNDSTLEEVKSELKRANDSISKVASAGGQAFSQMQTALLPNKIKAIETIWESVLSWDEMSAASMFVSVLPIEWVRKYGSYPSTKENFETLLKAPKHLDFLKDRKDVELVRPFVSERGWALYSAYHSFYISRITKASIFLIPGVDHSELFGRINERDLVAKSAPKNIVDLYDSNFMSGTTEYLKYLKEEMLAEFRMELSGDRDSSRAASNSASILKAANELIAKSSAQPSPPGNEPLRHVSAHNTYEPSQSQ